jgi:hypothetical protein
MTQTSRPWSGTTVGDAGPYTDLDWQAIYESELDRYYDSSVFPNIDKNYGGQLIVTSPAPFTLEVASGRATIRGSFFESDAIESFAVGASKTGNIVLQKDYVAQTVRIVVNEPYSFTQSDGVLWELQLCRFDTDGSGNVTISQPATGKQYLNTDVDSNMIDDLAVTTPKIADLNVSTGKIANKGVNSQKLGARATRLLSRQGGSLTQWETPGTTDYFFSDRTTVMIGKTEFSLGLGVNIATKTIVLPESTSGLSGGMVFTSVDRYSEVLAVVYDMAGGAIDPCFSYGSFSNSSVKQLDLGIYRIDSGIGLPEQTVWVNWKVFAPLTTGTNPSNPDPSTP